MDSEIINYADRAALRIKSRMRKLEIRGLNYNKAAVACARELACFAWGDDDESYPVIFFNSVFSGRERSDSGIAVHKQPSSKPVLGHFLIFRI